MSKRVWIVLIIVLCIISAGATYIIMNVRMKSLTAEYTARLSQLNNTIANLGNDVTVWTVQKTVKAGDEIKDEDLVAQIIKSSFDSEQYVHDKSSVVGKYYKIAVMPRTIMCSNMVMDFVLEDDMRDVDIALTAYTVGLRPGDYVDIYFTAPYGDRYLVLSHKRIIDIKDNLLKMYLTAEERHTYSGLLVDYYLNSQYGAVITGERYIEPGLQNNAVEYYAVPENVAQILQSDPNIVDAAEALATEKFRTSIEQALDIFRDNEDTVDTDATSLAAGRSEYYGTINDLNKDAQEEYEEEEVNNANAATQTTDEIWSSTGDAPADPNGGGAPADIGATSAAAAESEVQ